jgi:hypothetical protein
MASTPLPPQQLAPDLTEHAGLWVAIRDGRVVEAHRTPDELVAALHRRDITDATVMRLPGEYDKELVGLG